MIETHENMTYMDGNYENPPNRLLAAGEEALSMDIMIDAEQIIAHSIPIPPKERKLESTKNLIKAKLGAKNITWRITIFSCAMSYV